MKIKLCLALLAVCALVAPAQNRVATRRTAGQLVAPRQVSNVTANVLPIRRVILYSNGVAYIERRGVVSGNAEVNLSFKQSQVDDVLKSMLVLDLGAGRIGAVSYNSSAPSAARMAEIPFNVDAETAGATGGLAGVLAQLQGARAAVASTKGATSGAILTVEQREIKTADGKAIVPTSFLVIAGENGELTSFDLNEVRSVKLLDEGTQRDLTEFAQATASARRRDAKTITVTSEGAGQREMIVSYTIAAPIWKTTYRVVLDEAGKPFFQGWAIVDNVSDEDWRDVNLSLVSGTPVSFIQQIQQPFYRYRPIVPLPTDLKLNPQTYEEGGFNFSSSIIGGTVTDTNGAVIPGAAVTIRSNSTGQQFSVSSDSNGNFKTSALTAGNYIVTVSSPNFQQLVVRDVQVGAGVANNLNLTLQVGNASATVDVSSAEVQSLPLNGRSNQQFLQLSSGVATNNSLLNSAAPKTTEISDALTNNRSGVETAATGAEVGDLFEYRIAQPVTVSRNRSALIPIVQTKMDGERISIYNQAVRQDRPMSGMLLKNLTDLTLESGALTVIDRDAYAGEALMERLKPKEQRLISFALDLGTLITTKQEEDREAARLVKAINGTFQVHYFRTDKKIYTLQNQSDRDRTVYIEHPIRQNWDLTDDSVKPALTTQRYYRFRVQLKPFEKIVLPVNERQALLDSYQLRDLSSTDLEMFIARRYINEATRQKLSNLINLRQQINSIQTKSAALDVEVQKIGEDQARLRENIEALSKTPEAKTLIARYIAKADEQETRLEQISRERQNLQIERERLENELAAAIRVFEV